MNYRARLKPLLIYLLPSAIFISCCTAVAAFGGYRVNLTDSVPMGVWQQTSIEESRFIEFCIQGEWAEVATDRGYLHKGVCDTGLAPMIKPVVARPGDLVQVTKAGISVNGAVVLAGNVRTHDSKGRAIAPYPAGVYGVAAGEVWAVSTHNDRSFDSRYFGPVRIKQVIAGLKPIWIVSSK